MADTPLTVEPTSRQFEPMSAVLDADTAYVLSRFAYARRRGADWVLESPLAHARVVLSGPAVALVHALARPLRPAEAAAAVPALSAEGAADVLRTLLQVGMLDPAEADGHACEPEALRVWEFHDLLFHARSRRGRHDAHAGATYRLQGRLPMPPVLKPARPDGALPLFAPDLDALEREDPPLSRVVEARRSIRRYDPERPVTLRQLGEFLYRVGRLADYQRLEVTTPKGTVPMAFAARPYPSGGSLYELELYPVIGRCEGAAPGLYRYDPERHALELYAGMTDDVAALLRSASHTGRASGVQVLLMLASRFGRLAWKYESIAYALTLKHVGVVYQAMYLAATAMGLAPCAIGTGDSDLFARAAGLDYYEEAAVGEFLLGSRRRHE